jgi:hypothetical protein
MVMEAGVSRGHGGVHAPLSGRGYVDGGDPVGAPAGAGFPPATFIRPSGPALSKTMLEGETIALVMK